ncbi:MAG TPA: N(4)-(beta-N-acetylglucosaminyl)-L-asparaginase [Bryobacteraceae bacterium]|nr:N(4)-(beta-N-acetylglucosaminyl)-L-asparaginase [Bryobacteraceae bacterium]
MNFTRRAAIIGATALPAIRALQAQARPKFIAISSANRNSGGINACSKAVQVMKAGGDTLDAVIQGVNIVELDIRDDSVGYGGLPNEDGVVELDSSCVHGPTRRMGAVGALQNIKTPSRVAQRVMLDTDHMFLVGAGALKFARAEGFAEDNLLTESSRLKYLVWKRGMRDPNGHSNWGPGVDAPPSEIKKDLRGSIEELKKEFPWAAESLLAEALHDAVHPPHGTINCIGMNEKGEMSTVTTTSGMAWKLAGRVGDSPIIGGGLWLDQDIGGAGSTGRGEENLRVAGAHTIVENMRHGMTPREAALDCLKRVARNFDNDERRLAAIDIQFYVLRKDGAYCGASLWSGAQFAVCDETPARHESSVYLFEKKG